MEFQPNLIPGVIWGCCSPVRDRLGKLSEETLEVSAVQASVHCLLAATSLRDVILSNASMDSPIQASMAIAMAQSYFETPQNTVPHELVLEALRGSEQTTQALANGNIGGNVGQQSSTGEDTHVNSTDGLQQAQSPESWTAGMAEPVSFARHVLARDPLSSATPDPEQGMLARNAQDGHSDSCASGTSTPEGPTVTRQQHSFEEGSHWKNSGQVQKFAQTVATNINEMVKRMPAQARWIVGSHQMGDSDAMVVNVGNSSMLDLDIIRHFKGKGKTQVVVTIGAAIQICSDGRIARPVLKCGNYTYALRSWVECPSSHSGEQPLPVVHVWWQPSSCWFAISGDSVISEGSYRPNKACVAVFELLNSKESPETCNSAHLIHTSTLSLSSPLRASLGLHPDQQLPNTISCGMIRVLSKHAFAVSVIHPEKVEWAVPPPSIKETTHLLPRTSHTNYTSAIVQAIRAESAFSDSLVTVSLSGNACNANSVRGLDDIPNVMELNISFRNHASHEERLDVLNSTKKMMSRMSLMKCRIDMHFPSDPQAVVLPELVRSVADLLQTKMPCSKLVELHLVGFSSLFRQAAQAMRTGCFMQHSHLRHLDMTNSIVSSSSLVKLISRKNGQTSDSCEELDIGQTGFQNGLNNIQSISTLQSLNMTKCSLNDGQGVHDLSIILAKNLSIISLKLGENELDFVAINDLASASAGLTKLQRLQLPRNRITDDGVGQLVYALARMPHLVDFCLYNNNITGSGSAQICTCLENCPSLRRFRSNIMPSAAVRSFTRTLQYHPNLVSLSLSKNSMLSAGISALSSELLRCHFLTNLDITGNKIDDQGAFELAKALPHMTSLTSLNMYDNTMGNAGGAAIAKKLEKLTRLVALYSNRLGMDGCRYLAGAMKKLTRLSRLHLAYNAITAGGMEQLSQAFCHVTQLRSLDIQGNDLRHDGVNHLSSGLKDLPNLLALNAGEMALSATHGDLHFARSSLRGLFSVLKGCKQLHTLKLEKMFSDEARISKDSVYIPWLELDLMDLHKSLPKLARLVLVDTKQTKTLNSFMPALQKQIESRDADLKHSLSTASLRMSTSLNHPSIVDIQAPSVVLAGPPVLLTLPPMYSSAARLCWKSPSKPWLPSQSVEVDLNFTDTNVPGTVWAEPPRSVTEVQYAVQMKIAGEWTRPGQWSPVVSLSHTPALTHRLRNAGHSDTSHPQSRDDSFGQDCDGVAMEVASHGAEDDDGSCAEVPIAISDHSHSENSDVGQGEDDSNAGPSVPQVAQLLEARKRCLKAESSLRKVRLMRADAASALNAQAAKNVFLRSQIDAALDRKEAIIRDLQSVSAQLASLSSQSRKAEHQLQQASETKRHRDKEFTDVERQVRPRLEQEMKQTFAVQRGWQGFDALLRSGRVEALDMEDIAKLLKCLHMDNYVDSFREARIDGATLKGLVATHWSTVYSMLKQVHLTGKGVVHRVRLLHILKLISSRDFAQDSYELLSQPLPASAFDSEQAVFQWLRARGMDVLVDAFANNDIKGIAFENLCPDDIVELALDNGLQMTDALRFSRLFPVNSRTTEVSRDSAAAVVGGQDSRGAASVEIPEDFLCPIGRDIMSEPVVAADGFTYDRCNIQQWFNSRPTAHSPMTNAALESRVLIPNLTMQSSIQRFKDAHPELNL